MKHFSPPLLQPAIVIVSDLHIEGRIRLQTHGRLQVRAFAAQEIHLKARYRFHESSRARERVRIRMTSQIGRRVAKPEEARLHDVPMHEDTYLGILEQRYIFTRPGTYAGEVHLLATYTEGPWTGKPAQTEVTEEARIPIRIEVR